jgi:beta-galactosidase
MRSPGGQVLLREPAPRRAVPATPEGARQLRVPASEGVRIGPGRFDPVTGALTAIGEYEITGPVVDLWRAPTDNDIGAGLADQWRAIGLHRLHQRVTSIRLDDDHLGVSTRIAAAASDLAFVVTYLWHAPTPEELALQVTAEPLGVWPCAIPRFGVRMALPEMLSQSEWFGPGPGEAYPDTRAAARIGRWTMSVDAMQTPYVRPQENGNRVEARWLHLTDATGSGGIEITGAPTFDFTVRRWTTEDLEAARHPHELRARERLYLNLDVAHHGIGSGSCGPVTLERYRLDAAPFITMTMVFRPC